MTDPDKDRKAYAQGVAAAFDDLPDGAFFAALEEAGVDPEDLIEEEVGDDQV